MAEEINIYYVDFLTENKTIYEHINSCVCRLLRHTGHQANFFGDPFFEQILETGIQILFFDWSTLCELHHMENWTPYLQRAQKYLSPPAVVFVPEEQEELLLALGQEPLPGGLECLAVATKYKEHRQGLFIQAIDVGQIKILQLQAHIWTKFPDRGCPSLYYEGRKIGQDIKTISDSCAIWPDNPLELECFVSTGKTLNHYQNFVKAQGLFHDCWTVLHAEHPLLNRDHQATPGLRFTRKGDAVEVFQKVQGPETKSQAAGSNGKRRCHYREFCRSANCCRFFHTKDENRLFAGGSSRYELKKLKACNGCQHPARLCHFLHEGEQPLCIRCLQSSCIPECNPDYQRELLIGKGLQELIERGYVRL